MTNSQKLSPLDLTAEENNQISTIARDHKFRVSNDSMLYSKDPIEKAEWFLKSCRFLVNIASSVRSEHPEVFKKIGEYISQFDKVYENLKTLIHRYYNAQLGHLSIKRAITNIIEENELKINNVIDTVYPIGKRVENYDPDESVGYH